jgi:hypothetical protein
MLCLEQIILCGHGAGQLPNPALFFIFWASADFDQAFAPNPRQGPGQALFLHGQTLRFIHELLPGASPAPSFFVENVQPLFLMWLNVSSEYSLPFSESPSSPPCPGETHRSRLLRSSSLLVTIPWKSPLNQTDYAFDHRTIYLLLAGLHLMLAIIRTSRYKNWFDSNPDKRDKCLSQILFLQKNEKIICKALKN